MRRQEKADRIRRILDDLYPMPAPPLRRSDPYRLLVCVILSAQCTDVRVNQIAPLLFDAADDPRAMSELPVSRIERIIRPCGLAPAKAKNIHRMSRMLLREHQGAVPRSFEELERLPGVGHKSASVVMAQAFGEPAFPVDTHVHRLAARWGLSDGHSVVKTERDLKRLFPRDRWHATHLQIIYFGREHCPARGHDLATCRICSWAASKRRIREESRGRRGA